MSLLFPYHDAMAYNCWGEGNYVLLIANTWISSFVVLVYDIIIFACRIVKRIPFVRFLFGSSDSRGR